MSLFPAFVASGRDSFRVADFTPSQTAGETCLVGEFWYYDTATNKAKRCGANPATIAGLSEIVTENARTFTPTGQVPLFQLDTETVVGLSSTTTLVEATHRGQQYGITRDSTTGYWQLDTSKTGGNARVLVRSVDTSSNTAFCTVLDANLQFANI